MIITEGNKLQILKIDYDVLEINPYIAHFLEHCVCDYFERQNYKIYGVTTHDYIFFLSENELTFYDQFVITENIFRRQKKIILNEIQEEKKLNNDRLQSIKKAFFDTSKYAESILGDDILIEKLSLDELNQALKLCLNFLYKTNNRSFTKEPLDKERNWNNFMIHKDKKNSLEIVKLSTGNIIPFSYFILLKYYLEYKFLDKIFLMIIKKREILIIYDFSETNLKQLLRDMSLKDYLQVIERISNDELHASITNSAFIQLDDNLLTFKKMLEFNVFLLSKLYSENELSALQPTYYWIRCRLFNNNGQYINLEKVKEKLKINITKYRLEGVYIIFEATINYSESESHQHLLTFNSNFEKLFSSFYSDAQFAYALKDSFKLEIANMYADHIVHIPLILSLNKITDKEHKILVSSNQLSFIQKECKPFKTKEKILLEIEIDNKNSSFLLFHEALMYKGQEFLSFETFLRNQGKVYSINQSFVSDSFTTLFYIDINSSSINETKKITIEWLKYLKQNLSESFEAINQSLTNVTSKNKWRTLEREYFYGENKYNLNEYKKTIENILTNMEKSYE